MTKHVPVPVPGGAKWCHKCASVKPLGSFYVDRSKPDGRCHCCRRCYLGRRADAGRNREAFARLYVQLRRS